VLKHQIFNIVKQLIMSDNRFGILSENSDIFDKDSNDSDNDSPIEESPESDIMRSHIPLPSKPRLRDTISENSSMSECPLYGCTGNKRILCYSSLNNEICKYSRNCIFAHDFSEQLIDEYRQRTFEIILDKKLSGFSMLDDARKETYYKYLTIMTNMCDSCRKGNCPGGFNCRNGAFHPNFKICKNDLIMGGCINPNLKLNMDDDLISRFSVEFCDQYVGCINGHHLTLRGIVPHRKYGRSKDNRTQIQSVRYIEEVIRGYETRADKTNIVESDSESDTDSDMDKWFLEVQVDSQEELYYVGGREQEHDI
jgi:hypothetical protein